MTATRTILVTIDVDVIGGLRWEDRTAGVEWSTGRYGPALTDERDERRMWAEMLLEGLANVATYARGSGQLDSVTVNGLGWSVTITGPADHPLIKAATGTTTVHR